MYKSHWHHCEKHNIDYPSYGCCPHCSKDMPKAVGGFFDDKQYSPDEDSEELLIEPSNIRLRLREIYWTVMAEIVSWLDYAYFNLSNK